MLKSTSVLANWGRDNTKDQNSLLDFKADYLQVHIYKSLWSCQTIMFHGKSYYLTRLGFGFDITLQIMKSVIRAVLSQEEAIKKTTSAYVIDIYVNEDVVHVSCTAEFLSCFDLISKYTEYLVNGAKVLGLMVLEENRISQWKLITRIKMLFLCSKLVRYLPVYGWLCAAITSIKCTEQVQ